VLARCVTIPNAGVRNSGIQERYLITWGSYQILLDPERAVRCVKSPISVISILRQVVEFLRGLVFDVLLMNLTPSRTALPIRSVRSTCSPICPGRSLQAE